ncbi:alpha/beta hydrolase [Haloprofundus halophilus]|uniref:alpha/beta hydrolase n=1 Tax=Haloprofundus halophilus TaxID=2283527 RepID=UPI000E44E58B|nr:alpha/beta hydrolase [Haloprofundus halophilus]
MSREESAWRHREGVDATTGEQRRPSRYEFSTVSVRFDSDDERCVGTLYRPDRPKNPPLVLMAAGFGSDREFGLPVYAERFAERGYAVFLFDHRHFGDSEGEPRNLVSPAKQIADWRAAIERADELDGVDADRLVLWGSSFAGGHVLEVAAGEPHVAAVVSQVPFVDGRSMTLGKGLKFAAKSLPLALADKLLSFVGRSKTVPVVGTPEEFAVINEPGAKTGFFDLVPSGSDWENETPARVFLSIPGYRPGTKTDEVHCPTLVVAGEHDELVSLSDVESAASKLPNGTFLRLPVGHFDVYGGETFEEALAHQFAFLDRVVGDPADD